MRAAKTKVVWDLDPEEIATMFPKRDGPRGSFDDVDLEDPVALEPSWDKERSQRSSPWRQKSGTLLDDAPVSKADTELTLTRSTL